MANDPIPIDDPTLSLRQIIDSAPALTDTGWPASHRDFLNQTWLMYGGRSPEELQGLGVDCIRPPENVEGIVEKWCESLASGEPLLHEARILHADGEYRWMLSHKVASLFRRDEDFVLDGGEHSKQPGPPSVLLLGSALMRPALDTYQRLVV
jgi:PAS fold.